MNAGLLLGFDIGDTKCTACLGQAQGNILTILKRREIPTDHTVSPAVMRSG